VQDEQRIQDYLSGRLSAAEAEAFEAKMFADDALAAEVEQALEIRAALQKPGASQPVAAHRGNWRSRSHMRPAWALAASIAVAGIGLFWFRAQSPSTPVFRGVEQTMGLQVEVAGGKLDARWAAVPGAHEYELQIFEADGQLTDSVPSDGTRLVLELREGASHAYAEVVALDNLGQTMLRSQRVRLSPDGN
jgi:hypothetical protein